MTEHRLYSGPDLAPLLRQVRDELGSDAEIVRAERIRTGGLAGFFAREHYEVTAKRPHAALSASKEPTVPTESRPNVAGELSAAETVADQQISQPPPSTGPDELVESATRRTASAQASSPTPTGPPTTEPVVSAGGTGRSIQAALLDRADRVSTEELLVRVAETHSAEWGSESFQSILGRAMVDAVGPSVDVPSIEERRRELSPVDDGRDRSDAAIAGLRLESIRPGENVVDPVPQPPTAELSVGHEGARNPERESDLRHPMPSSGGNDRWPGQPQGAVPPPWPDDGPPPWAQLWMQGWAPWMSNGRPAHNPDDSTPKSAPHPLCANCADSLSADTERDAWSEVRREIDEVRRKLDDILGTIRQVTGDEYCGRGREPTETGSDDGQGPHSDHYRTDR